MSRIVPLIVGAGGMLGRALAARFEEAHPATITATRAEIDVSDRFRLEAEIERLQPTVVINCAAWTDVDGCEADAGRARRVNAEGAENVARAARGAGCRLIHLSTDFVFDGRRRAPYREEDAPAPLSVYGRTKLEGEERIAAVGGDVLIVRSGWLYGSRPGRPGFVDAVRGRLAAGDVVRVVTDQSGSPTWVADLAGALGRLLAVERRGLLHVANAGTCTRFEMAVEVARAAGADLSRVVPIRTAESGRVAARPAFSALDTSAYAALAGAPLRPWREALLDYLGRRGGTA